jgi:hypothetical protein
MSSNIVIGVFDDYGVVDKAIDELKRSGVLDEQISVLGSSQKHAAALDPAVHPTNVPENLAKFVAAGAVAGGVLGGLTALIFPGIGLLAAGSWLMVLSEAAAGSYAGFLVGALTRMDISEVDAQIYESQLTQGRILVGIDTKDAQQQTKVQAVFDSLGAIDVRKGSQGTSTTTKS